MLPEERPSVVLGTIHLATEDAFFHWDRIAKLIDTYDNVFTESSLEYSSQQVINKYVFFNEPDIFLQYVTNNRWQRMRKTFIKYFNVDIERMRDMRPLFILSSLYQSIEPSHGSSLDHRIWSYAEEKGKSVDGIETVEEQIQIMLGLSIRMQYRQLVRMSLRISGLKAKYRSILEAYQEEDVLKLLNLSKSSLGLDRSTLLQNRNEIMVDRMMGNHNKQPSFFCFGAGHIAGSDGVIALLKKNGALVRALKN
ncbi:MAG: hypothetical protein ACI9FN_000073 [Saprospiraceae bacterium]|jgi:uncharacterized protein YbaP (TraB family)